jgi:alpha-galactosidase
MNRCLSEVGNEILPAVRQRELWHRYVLGVYDIMGRLADDFPNILLENCSSGGARFDPGMLFYSVQIWTSDVTDAIDRLKIQLGTSLVYPVSAMGAHVSDCPNHATGRSVPFSARGHVALSGTFGYELDITKISQEDRDAIPGQISDYKKYSDLVREGDLYRLSDLFESNQFEAWMFVSKDKSESLLEFVNVLGRVNTPSRKIRLKGLDENALYAINGRPALSGSALMHAGIHLNVRGDFHSILMHLKKISPESKLRESDASCPGICQNAL